MPRKIFSIFDKKALSYFDPFFQHNRGLALRGFGELVNDPKTALNKYPADFSLWELGEFDETSGVILAHPKPVFVDEAANCLKQGA